MQCDLASLVFCLLIEIDVDIVRLLRLFEWLCNENYPLVLPMSEKVSARIEGLVVTLSLIYRNLLAPF